MEITRSKTTSYQEVVPKTIAGFKTWMFTSGSTTGDNTYNKTGLTPSQLAEHWKDLIAACKIGLEYIDQANKCSKPDCRVCMRLKQDKKTILEAIAKAEAV